MVYGRAEGVRALQVGPTWMAMQIYRHLNAELRRAMDESIAWMDESLARGDFKEGVASFVARRPPKFAPIEVD